MTVIPASFPGVCGLCGGRYPAGADIKKVAPSEYVGGVFKANWAHAVCPDPLPAVRVGEVACTDCFLIHPVGECW